MLQYKNHDKVSENVLEMNLEYFNNFHKVGYPTKEYPVTKDDLSRYFEVQERASKYLELFQEPEENLEWVLNQEIEELCKTLEQLKELPRGYLEQYCLSTYSPYQNYLEIMEYLLSINVGITRYFVTKCFSRNDYPIIELLCKYILTRDIVECWKKSFRCEYVYLVAPPNCSILHKYKLI